MSMTLDIRPTPTRAEGDAGRQRARWLRFLTDHWQGGLLLAALLVGAALIHTTNLAGYPARSIDEGTYASQAWAVLEKSSLAPYTYWYDHPPVGWLLLSAVLAVTRGLTRLDSAVVAAREVMSLFHIASCALLYLWGRRLGFGRAWAGLAVALYGLSPLVVFFSRMVLLDNLATPLVLAAFVLAVSPSRRLLAGAAAGLAFGLACLTKETSLLLLPALAWQLWQGSEPATRRYVLTVATSLFGLTLLGYLLFALLRGELLPGEGHVSLWDGVAFQLFTRDGTPPLWQGGSLQLGTVKRWLSVDPWLVTAGAIAVVPALAWRRLRPAAAALLLLGASAATTRYLPAMFVIAVLPLAALLAAGVLDSIWKLRAGARFVERPGVPVALAAVTLLALTVTPAWAATLERQLTRDEDAPVRQAYAWIMEHAEPGTRLLVDEPLRIELVVNGDLPEDDVVWIYKLDFDPEVAEANPGGWRDFDYVITTDTSRSDPFMGPQVKAAMRDSQLLASFTPPGFPGGDTRLTPGQELVEIRRVVNDRSVVRDNRAREWIIDPRDETRYEVEGERLARAIERYGDMVTRDAFGRPIYLTGWQEEPAEKVLSP